MSAPIFIIIIWQSK